ncbi:hypothetical protein IJ098_02060 [Candidatus Saccharibacteria bacterium]|nr:hypothetical protein [Candidatus Saccharibacteria bacterium]
MFVKGKEHKQNNVMGGGLYRYKLAAQAAGIFIFAFITTFIASSVFAPQSITNADTLYFSFTGSDYTASVHSADNLVISLEGTADGALGVAHDTITTTTNNPAGYQLYFSMDQVSDYDATHPGNALYQDGNSTSSNFLSPATGTISAPAALTNNTWGFALLGGANRQAGVPDTFANFDPVYIDSNGDSSDGTTGGTVNPGNKFAPVPLRSGAVKVQEMNSATSSAGQNLDVYYAAKANIALPSGEYSGVVNYFVVSDTSVSSFDTISPFPSVLNYAGGQDLVIVTSLHSNYAFTSSDITVTLTDKNNSSNTATCPITDINADSGNVTVTCTTPALVAGNYDLEVEIPTYGKDWTTDVQVTGVTPTFWNITYMQEMTSDICAAATTPASSATQADTDGSHAGSSAYVPQRTLYDWRGADGTGTTNSKVAPSSANAKGYIIRKLADGNCWMTQNLEIPLSTTAGVEVVSNSSGNLAPATPNSTTQQGTITSAGIWTPTGTGGTGNGTTPMNGNTKAANNTYYYSWYAATAGSGLSTDVNTDAPFSICPKGWRLPYNYTIDSSTTSKSYSNMTKAYLNITTNTSTSTGYQTLEAFPLNFARSGYVGSGAFNSSGYGYYWSSTAYSSATYAYYLLYDTAFVGPQHNDRKYYGFNVRCVAV